MNFVQKKQNAWMADLTLKSIATAMLITLSATTGFAQTSDLVSQNAFRVCADPANLPHSNKAGDGFENQIAKVFADELGLPVEYTWFPMALGFVRQTLRLGKCDAIIGYAQGHELVLNTNHYYTSTHILVTRDDSDLSGVDFLGDPALKGRRVGVIAGTPPATHLAKYGLMATAKGYNLMVDRRIESPNEKMLSDLKSGEIDAAVMWGPVGGPAVKAAGGLNAVPLFKEVAAPRMFYRITLGVRRGELVWKRKLNSIIRRRQGEIDAILRNAGVPLLNDLGDGLKEVE